MSLVYGRLKIKSVDIYASADLDLDYKGITVIYGANKDANAGSTNAAGKSRLFSFLPEILFNSSPLVSKRDKRTRGIEKLLLRRGDTEVVVTRTASRSKENLQLSFNGKDLGIRTVTYHRDRLAKFLDRTEDEFYSLDYLDSSRASLIQRGSSAQRRSFLITLFRLDDVDTIRQVFTQELRKVSTDKAVLSELQQRVRVLRRSLRDVDTKELQDKIESLQRTISKANARIETLLATRLLLELRETSSSQLDVLKKNGLSLRSKLQDELDDVKDKIERLEDQAESARHYQSYLTHYREWKETNGEAVRALDKLGLSPDDADLIRTRLLKYTTLAKEADRLKDTLTSLEELVLEKEDYNQDHLDIDIDAWKSKLANLQSLQALRGKVSRGCCPTCKQTVPDKLFNGLDERTAVAARTVSRYELAHDAYLRQKARKKGLAQVKATRHEYEDVAQKARKLGLYQKAADLINNITSPPKKVKPTTVDLVTIKARLKKLRALQAAIESVLPIQDKLVAAMDITDEQLKGYSSLDDLRDKVSRCMERLPLYQSQLDSAKSAKRELRELAVKLLPLEESANTEGALKLLIEAYGNEGIKRIMLQRLAVRLQELFNTYAKYVFSENYTFEAKIGTQVEILAHKRYANTVKTMEVRRFSGAESRMFNLLCVMSFVSLMPAARRSNLLVLDEPTANMGSEMRENFWRFLPILNKVIPHIVVITPNSDEGIPSARYFTAVKERGVSRLVPGKVRV